MSGRIFRTYLADRVSNRLQTLDNFCGSLFGCASQEFYVIALDINIHVVVIDSKPWYCFVSMGSLLGGFIAG